MSAEEPLYIATCQNCNQRMKVPGKAIGRSYKCVKCGEHLTLDQQNLVPFTENTATVESEAPTEVIGQLLLTENIINNEQLKEGLSHQQAQGGRLFEILIQLGHLDKNNLHSFLSKQAGVATIELSRMRVDTDIVKIIPKEMALDSLVLPIDKLGKLLTVAMVCPLDMATVAQIEEFTGLRVKSVLCHYDDIQLAVEHYYRETKTDNADLASFNLPTAMVKEKRLDLSDKIHQVNDLPASRTHLNHLETLTKDKASSPQDLVLAISADPVITAYVLRIANSPAFTMPGDVDSVALALTLIDRAGLQHVIEHCKENMHDDPLQQQWSEQARKASIVATAIATNNQRIGRSVAHSIGILAELGRFILLDLAPQDYKSIDPKHHGANLLDTERRLLAVTHVEASAALVARWRFPDTLSDALKNGAQPGTAGELQALAALAGLTPSLAQDPAECNLQIYQDHLKILGLSENKVRNIAQEALKNT